MRVLHGRDRPNGVQAAGSSADEGTALAQERERSHVDAGSCRQPDMMKPHGRVRSGGRRYCFTHWHYRPGRGL